MHNRYKETNVVKVGQKKKKFEIEKCAILKDLFDFKSLKTGVELQWDSWDQSTFMWEKGTVEVHIYFQQRIWGKTWEMLLTGPEHPIQK